VAKGALEREALIGVAIAGGFGIGWALWAASGLTGSTALIVRIVGVTLGAIIVVGAMVNRGSDAPYDSASNGGAGSMFRSRGYLLWVVAELMALVAGNVVLGSTGQSNYVAAWTAFVVGVHFLGFGRLFVAMFYWVGGAFVLAAIVGAATGAASGSRHAAEASTGLIAAVTLFAAGAWGLLAYRSSDAAAATP
jgi:hypothetical protein